MIRWPMRPTLGVFESLRFMNRLETVLKAGQRGLRGGPSPQAASLRSQEGAGDHP